MIVNFGKDIVYFYTLDSGDLLFSFTKYTAEQLIYLIKCIETRIKGMKKEDNMNLIKEMLKEYEVYFVCPTSLNNGETGKFLDKCDKDYFLSLTKMFQDMTPKDKVSWYIKDSENG